MSFSGDWKYPVDLPVVGKRAEIVEAVRRHQVVVVVSDTGSGKTTQLPKMVAEALDLDSRIQRPEARIQRPEARGKRPETRGKSLIGCTQPRRIAAVSVAKRVAEELGVELGGYVGYQVRFDEKRSAETRIKFMTDGILLAESQGDRSLAKYDALILDEAHERSLNIDFLLGYLKGVLERRPEMRVVISSATLDAGAFAEFFAGEGREVPVIEAEGRMYPVSEFFLPGSDDEELATHVGRGVEFLEELGEHGDVLVFLPGEREIRDVAELLEGRRFPNTEVLPLYARLGLNEQQRVFQPGRLRRIVLATNVAETSLTIPRIRCVVDTGLARVSRWVPSRGVQKLQVEPISRASARQRKGRCGRVMDGVCVRLYEKEDLEDRQEFTDPEIRRSSLAGVILRMKALGLPEISEFPFLDPPNAKAVAEGYRTLREVGALDEKREMTEIGKELARLPLEPRMGRMLVEARKEKCEEEVVVIVAGLEVGDVRERPAEKKAEADHAHAKWQDVESDFIGRLRLWRDLEGFYDGRRWRWNQLRKFCGVNFLNAKRVTEWGNVVEELSELCGIGKGGGNKAAVNYGGVHRSLLAGVPRQFGIWDRENKSYRSAGGGFFAVFPGSGLFGLKKRPEWVMGLEMVETSRLWARCVAEIEPEWLEVVAPHLCRSRYGEAHWDEQQGAVYGRETVICGGLHVVEGRRVHYGRVDRKAAHGVFVREGILGGGLRKKAPFLDRLEALREEVVMLEEKLRRPGMLWDEDHVVGMLEERIPEEISTAAAFHKWRVGNEEMLLLGLEDVLREDVSGLDFFPDVLRHEGAEYAVYYRCAPGERDDGVTLGVHVDQLPGLVEWLPGWGVDGNLEERVEQLMRGLPKDFRRLCQPIGEMARGFAELWCGAPKDRPVVNALAEYLSEKLGVVVPSGEFDEGRLSEELVTKIWVCDDEGEELAMGRDVMELKLKLAERLRQRFEAAATADVERRGMSVWDGEELPEEVMTAGGAAYPALVDEGGTVGVRAYVDFAEAAEAHRRGGARLLVLGAEREVEFLRKKFPMSLLAKVELGRLSLQVEDLILLTADGLVDGSYPRSPAGFVDLAERARGRWYEKALTIGEVLEEMIEGEREMRDWIDGKMSDRNYGEIASDLREVLDWLLREGFAWKAGYRRFVDYPRQFRGMKTRLGRLVSFPLVKDLEKMEMMKSLWGGWYARWRESPEQVGLWKIGWMLMEWRISLFAPDVPVVEKVSAKRIEEMLREV